MKVHYVPTVLLLGSAVVLLLSALVAVVAGGLAAAWLVLEILVWRF